MNIKEVFGQRVKTLRKGLNISQEELAFRAGIDRTYITGIENGKRNVSLEIICKVIKGLDTTFESFFKGISV